VCPVPGPFRSRSRSPSPALWAPSPGGRGGRGEDLYGGRNGPVPSRDPPSRGETSSLMMWASLRAVRPEFPATEQRRSVPCPPALARRPSGRRNTIAVSIAAARSVVTSCAARSARRARNKIQSGPGTPPPSRRARAAGELVHREPDGPEGVSSCASGERSVAGRVVSSITRWDACPESFRRPRRGRGRGP